MKPNRPKSALRTLVRFVVRSIAFVGLLFLAVTVAAAVALRFLVTPEGLKSLIATQLQEALQRPVQIEDVNVMVLQGIRLRGLRVLEAPGYPGGEFLSSEVAVAKYRWAALLERRLDFSEVRIVSPRIHVTRREDGEWNLKSLFRPRTASTEAARGVLLPVSPVADVMSIEDAHVSFKDLARKRSIEVKAFNLELQDFSLGTAFPVRASFVMDSDIGGKPVQLKISLSGRAALEGLRWTEATLEAERLRVEVDGDPIVGTGSLKDYSAPAVDLRLKLPRLTSENLGRYWTVAPGLSVPPSLARLRLKFPTPQVMNLDSVDWAAEPLRFRANGSVNFGEETTYRVNVTAPQAPLERVAGLWSGFAPKQFVGVADVKTVASGKLGKGERPTIDQLNVVIKGFAAILSTNAAVSGAEIAVNASKHFDDVEYRVPKGRLDAYGNTVTELDVILRLAGGDLDVERLDGTWGISKFKLKGRIRNLAAPKGVDVEGTIDKLNLLEAINATAALAQQLRTPKPEPQQERKWSQVFKYAIPKSFPATNGNLRIAELTYPNFNTLSVDVKWGLQGISTGLDRASGWVRTGFGPGRASNIPELESGHRLIRLTFLPFTFMHRMNKAAELSLATAYPKTLDFNRIYGQYRVQDGVMDICAFHVDSHQLILFADGKVDFPKEKVGLHVFTRLTKSQVALPQFFVDTQGRPSIAFYIKNDLNKPEAEVDFRKIDSTAIEDALQAGLKCSQ